MASSIDWSVVPRQTWQRLTYIVSESRQLPKRACDGDGVATAGNAHTIFDEGKFEHAWLASSIAWRTHFQEPHAQAVSLACEIYGNLYSQVRFTDKTNLASEPKRNVERLTAVGPILPLLPPPLQRRVINDFRRLAPAARVGPVLAFARSSAFDCLKESDQSFLVDDAVRNFERVTEAYANRRRRAASAEAIAMLYDHLDVRQNLAVDYACKEIGLKQLLDAKLDQRYEKILVQHLDQFFSNTNPRALEEKLLAGIAALRADFLSLSCDHASAVDRFASSALISQKLSDALGEMRAYCQTH